MNSAVHQALTEYVASKALSEQYNSHYCDEARNARASLSLSYEHDGLALLDCLSAMWDNRTTTLNALHALRADLARYPSSELCDCHGSGSVTE